MADDIYDLAYYYSLRTASRDRVVQALNNRVKAEGGRENWDKLTLCSIDKQALDVARLEWPKYYNSDTHQGFPESWEKLFFRFRHNPAFFDLAIWQDIEGRKTLQGLALGRPSSGKKNLNICWIERSFAPGYFKGGILLPILACAEEYGKLLGAEQIVLKNVIDGDIFQKYGYATLGNPKDKNFKKEIKL